MKRFYREVSVGEAASGFQVLLDGRPLRTQSGGAQAVPSRALAEALAEEWRAQGDEIDPKSFVLRDLADYAIDRIAPDRAAAAARMLPFAETDTLCYRADPDEPLFRRQQELWEPLLQAAEARHAIRLERVSGIIHRAQPPETLARLRELIENLDPFTLAALETLASLTASLTVALAALEEGSDPDALFAAANCEQDWQAELWGWDADAEADRTLRLETFRQAVRFARLARQG
ncbi:molecular chaperone [Altererythrobacter soli]|uniref:Molecular chaperone n=1 Tax=Croceibacterium soli TaxID=1739690 RepID=A0A6I4UW51_9SPHN|nr:ATP12 family protein [Croceibacterium soli]MXP41753.1 molecular chaperone [Croceibacterium soli]